MEKNLKDLLHDEYMDEQGEKKRRRQKSVLYDTKGRRVRKRLSKAARGVGTAAAVIAVLLSAIYIPPQFYKPKDDSSYNPLTADARMIRVAQQYYKEHPDADFDGDGMTNALEDQYGTDPYRVDSDFDGISDYAEVNITKTSPTAKSDNLLDEVRKDDKKHGYSIGTPYKIDDIILWPDSYSDKARGGVVRTLNGYRFSFYHGWVKFPEKVYVYAYEEGVHRELQHREEEDAWYIDGSYEVRCYSQPLTFANRLRVPFSGNIFLDDGKFAKTLSGILPDKGGPLTCQRVAEIDEDPDVSKDVKAPIVYPFVDKADASRFANNQNTLKDYTYVIKHIDAGYCVSVSMYSSSTGESIGVIYGYTSDGSLLVADPATLKPCGKIKVTEFAMRMMGKDGNIGQYTWFEWSGLGFDSLKYNDRISFVSTASSKDDTKPVAVSEKADSEQASENQSEKVTEKITRKQAETSDKKSGDENRKSGVKSSEKKMGTGNKETNKETNKTDSLKNAKEGMQAETDKEKESETLVNIFDSQSDSGQNDTKTPETKAPGTNSSGEGTSETKDSEVKGQKESSKPEKTETKDTVATFSLN